jgi:hypothetical protein
LADLQNKHTEMMALYEKAQHHAFRVNAAVRTAALWVEVYAISSTHDSLFNQTPFNNPATTVALKKDLISRADAAGWIQKIWQRGIDQLSHADQVHSSPHSFISRLASCQT